MDSTTPATNHDDLGNAKDGVRCSAWVGDARIGTARRLQDVPGAERSGRSESFLKIVLAQAAYAYETPCMNKNQIRLELTGTLYNGKKITVTTDTFPRTQDGFCRAQGNGLLAAASKGAYRKVESKEVEA